MTGMRMSRQNFCEIERLVLGGNVPHGRDGALHDKNVRAGFLRDRAESLGLLRNRADRGDRARVLDLANARGDQIFLHRFLINFLQQAR